MAESSRFPKNAANCPRNGNIASNALQHHYITPPPKKACP